MNRARRFLPLCLLPLFVLVLIVAGRSSSSPAADLTPAPAPAVGATDDDAARPGTAAAAIAPAPRPSGVESLRRRYEFSIDLSTRLDLDPRFLGRESGEAIVTRTATRMIGTLEVWTAARVGEGRLLGFATPVLDIETSDEEGSRGLERAMLEPFQQATTYVRTDAGGRFVEYLHDGRLPAPGRPLLRALLSTLQVPAHGADEDRLFGTVRVAVSRAEPGSLVRRIESVLELRTTDGASRIDSIEPAGEQCVTLSATGVVERITGRESLRLLGDGGAFEFLLVQRTDLRLVGETPSAAVGRSDLTIELEARRARSAGAGEELARIHAVRRAEAEMAEVAGRCVDDLLPAALARGEAGIAGRHRLALLLRHGPEALAEVERRLEGPGGEEIPTLLAALGTAGTAEAQQLLSRVSTATDRPEDVRLGAIFSLLQSTDPTPETIESLGQVVDQSDSETLALYGLQVLGTAAGRLAADAERLRALETIDRLARSRVGSSLDWQLGYITALGNSGRPEIVARLASAFESDREVVRHRAVRALRHVAGREAEVRLTEAARSDPSPAVRKEALRLLAGRRPTRLEILGRALEEDRARSVRLVALEALASRADDPSVRPSIERALRDPDPGVAGRALAILDGR